MTKQEFQELAKDLVLLDGAMGSNLILAGMPRGACTEQWALDHADIVMDLQKAYVDAGSQIVLAPTFGANCVSLAAHGLADRVSEMNRRLVDLSQKAVGGRAYIAGNLSTSGKVIGSSPDATYEEAMDRYREQSEALADAGVDLLVIETMLTVDETAAAMDAAQEIYGGDLPVLVSMTVETDGSLFFGGDVQSAAEIFQAMGASAFGVNCSAGPDQLASVVAGIRKRIDIPVIAKPNAGIPAIGENGEATYQMSPQAFAAHMERLVAAGAGIVGGCCGTTPDFIREMRKRLKPDKTGACLSV